jgi:diguanylate cyclase (GGDEF)-like protein
VARLGGDEFALVLEGLAAAVDATAVGEKLVAAMRAPFIVDHRNLQVSASVGVALLEGRDAFSASSLLARADAALYEAKRAGRDRVGHAGPVAAAEALAAG